MCSPAGARCSPCVCACHVFPAPTLSPSFPLMRESQVGLLHAPRGCPSARAHTSTGPRQCSGRLGGCGARGQGGEAIVVAGCDQPAPFWSRSLASCSWWRQPGGLYPQPPSWWHLCAGSGRSERRKLQCGGGWRKVCAPPLFFGQEREQHTQGRFLSAPALWEPLARFAGGVARCWGLGSHWRRLYQLCAVPA